MPTTIYPIGIIYFMTYKEQLLQPEWYAKRDYILRRDVICQRCHSDEELHVHHKVYNRGKMAWEYADDDLVVLCGECHVIFHNIFMKRYKNEAQYFSFQILDLNPTDVFIYEFRLDWMIEEHGAKNITILQDFLKLFLPKKRRFENG